MLPRWFVQRLLLLLLLGGGEQPLFFPKNHAIGNSRKCAVAKTTNLQHPILNTEYAAELQTLILILSL